MQSPRSASRTSVSVPTPDGSPAAPTPRRQGRYIRPDTVSRRLLNPAITFAMKLGLSPRGGRLLVVPRRVSGGVQHVPVNPLEIDGATYLVAPRGSTQWVRNLRHGGAAQLRTGRRVDDVVAVEVGDDDKVPVLRQYLRRWSAETSRFFDGADEHSSDAVLAELAPGIPVFRLAPAEPSLP